MWGEIKSSFTEIKIINKIANIKFMFDNCDFECQEVKIL